VIQSLEQKPQEKVNYQNLPEQYRFFIERLTSSNPPLPVFEEELARLGLNPKKESVEPSFREYPCRIYEFIDDSEKTDVIITYKAMSMSSGGGIVRGICLSLEPTNPLHRDEIKKRLQTIGRLERIGDYEIGSVMLVRFNRERPGLLAVV